MVETDICFDVGGSSISPTIAADRCLWGKLCPRCQLKLKDVEATHS